MSYVQDFDVQACGHCCWKDPAFEPWWNDRMTQAHKIFYLSVMHVFVDIAFVVDNAVEEGGGGSFFALLEKKAALKTASFLWQLFHIHVDVTGREKTADNKDNETDDKNKNELLQLRWYHQPYAHLVLESKNRLILALLPE